MEGDAALHRRQVTELYQFTDRTTFSVEISRNGVTETIRTTPEHPFAIYGSDARALSQREARGHAPANMAEWAERLNLPDLARQAGGDVAVLDRAQSRTNAMSWVKAADLKPGDRLILAEGEDAARVVALSADEGLSTVYNFAVDVDHTYFVGATKVWVHNIYSADAEFRLQSSKGRVGFADEAIAELDKLKLDLTPPGSGSDQTVRSLSPLGIADGLQRPGYQEHFIYTREHGWLDSYYSNDRVSVLPSAVTEYVLRPADAEFDPAMTRLQLQASAPLAATLWLGVYLGTGGDMYGNGGNLELADIILAGGAALESGLIGRAVSPMRRAYDATAWNDVRVAYSVSSTSQTGSGAFRLAAAERPFFYSGSALENIPLSRSPELGGVSTTAELLQRGLVPGTQGVTLGQRTVVFSDVWKLSEMHGVEFALTKEAGAWRLYSGGVSRVGTPLGAGVRVLAHTHPGGTMLPSAGDIRALNFNYDARLAVNPSASSYPSRVIYGPGVHDYTPFWPTNR